MGSVWLKNFFGIHCSDFELLSVPYPKTEFAVHVSLKTTQWGALVGLLYGTCNHIFRHGASNKSDQLRRAAVRGGLYGAGIGLIAGPLLSVGYFDRTMSKIDRYDKCYRLRFNRPQLIVDRISISGGLIGVALAGAPGFVAGVNVGVLCGLLLNGFESISLTI